VTKPTESIFIPLLIFLPLQVTTRVEEEEERRDYAANEPPASHVAAGHLVDEADATVPFPRVVFVRALNHLCL